MILDALGCVGSVLLLMWAMATSPHRFECPVGWWLPEGVRASGTFTCRPSPAGDDARSSSGFLVDHSVERHGFIEGQIYCAPADIPVIGSDGRTITCRQR